MSLKSFLTRLIWLCVLPLVILAAYFAIDHVRTLQTERDLEASNLARNFATAIDRHLDARISALQVLAASSAMGDPHRLREFYQEAQAFQKYFDSHVVLADLSHHMLLSTRVPYGTSLPNMPQVRGHSSVSTATATGKPAVGDIYLGPIAKVPMVSIAVPVIRDGRTILLLLSVIESRKLQQRLEELTIPHGWSITLLDGRDEVIARRSPQGMEGRQTGVEAPAGRYVARSAISPWSVVLEVPLAIYSAPLIATSTALVVAILAATLVGVLGGLLASRRLARSVAALAETPLLPTVRLEIAEIETVRRILIGAAAAREEAESMLQKSEERYRSLVESAPIAIFINRNSKIEYANPAAVRLFGANSKENVFGRSPYELVHPNFHAAMTERIKKLLQGGRVPLAETNILQANGIERTVEVIAATFVDHQGPAIQVLMHDITERKQADEALRESEERLRLLGDNLPDSYVYQYLHEADGTPRFLHLSAGMERLHGLRREDVLRDAGTLHRQIDPEQMPALAAMEAASLQSMADFVMELHMCRTDGEWRWLQVRSRPRRKADGQVLWDGVATDITERKRAEETLRESEASLKQAQRLAKVGNWSWVITRGEHIWSEEIYKIYGHNPGLPPAAYPEVATYFTPESWARLSAAVESGLARGVSYECDAEVVRTDGAPCWIVARGNSERDSSGKVVRLYGTVQDITERKLAEKEIRQLNTGLEQRVAERTAELLAANRELDAFAYAVSHDLRAPLRAMNGFSQALVEDYGEQLQGEAHVYLAQITLASRHMGELIDGLLTLSRSTREDLHRDQLDLSEMAGRIRNELVRQEPDRQVKWQIESGMLVRGDARMLEVVMRNLIGNAWKYTAGAPAPMIRVYSGDLNGAHCYCIADNGAGFDMSHSERLFKPFQRLHRQDEFPGIGIGLATVQRIIHRHGGEIGAEAEPGKGALFRFTLADSGISFS